jgi:GNAT superfamily N-acetyltransferase
MKMMEVVAAGVGDIEDLVRLRDELARWLVSRGIEQWHPGELPKDWIAHEAKHEWVHIVRESGRLVATVTVLPEDPIVWDDRNEPAGYLHRLMVDRHWAGQRVGAELLAWAEGTIRQSNRGIARLDCVRSNHRLCAYYEANGYSLVGYKDFPNLGWYESALYEKALG